VTERIRRGDIPGVQLRCRQLLEIDVEEAWRLLIEPSGLTQWLCEQAELDPVAGGAFAWHGVRGLEPGVAEQGTVMAIDPPDVCLLSLAQPGWSAATRVEWRLSRQQQGCELSVLQNGFEHLPLSHSLTVWEQYRRRWRAALERLAAARRP